MRCAKSELIVLLGVGMFLAGSISLITITMQKIFPAREEQTFKEINCTIVSGDMNATTKCSNKNQEGSYPCLRIYVLCGISSCLGYASADFGKSTNRSDFLL